MARDNVNIGYQIGVESTPGTAVAANKRFLCVMLDLSPKIRTKAFRANGKKTNTTKQLQRIWTEGKYEGALNYREIVFLLASLVGESGGVVTASSISTWEFFPASVGADSNSKSLTIQKGDSTHAQQATYCKVVSMAVKISKDDAMISGDIVGRALADATLTASPTEIDQLPVNINEVDVFFDTSFGGIGGTKLTDVMAVEFDIGKKFDTKEVLNTDFQSFKEMIEVPYEVKGKITVEYNAQTQAIYNAVIASGLPFRFLRVKCTGPTLGAGNHTISLDMAAKIEAAESKDQDGVFAYEFTFEAIDNVTMGRSWAITVQNDITGLT